ncbi:MAG TPA: ABC transporter permease [Cytophagales bacterium]|nr:ABC transporter permease [Cytophagales bacterium]
MRTIKLIFESFIFAFEALKSNLLRTTLSLLGVTIGIFTIVTVYSLIDGIERGFRKSFSFVGENVVYVEKWPWSFEGNYPWWKYVNRPQVNYEEFKFLEENLELTEGTSIFSRKDNITLKRESNSIENINLVGVSYGYNLVTDIPIGKGRYFNIQEVELGRNVAIIGSNIEETLFPNQEAIGKEIKVRGLKFVVIGVMERQGENFLEGLPSKDLECYIPYKSFTKLYYTSSDEGIGSSVIIKGKTTDPGLNELEGEIKGLMRAKRGLKPMEEDNFAVNKSEMLSTAINAIFSFLGVAGAIIGSFSLIVGCFGIANIMFVSVKERTNLIGIQKSLGAKNYFILFQFLYEAVFLSIIGGGVGIFLVFLITLLPLGSLEIYLSFNNVFLGLGIATIIGCIAGIIPAALAARLDPVIAIRSK